ncbi:MAG TPA: CHAT domain-containing protein, partial [Erythrobacter sp.]|nr:CHAT domain-containing protein [Erythrobacter sp.]
MTPMKLFAGVAILACTAAFSIGTEILAARDLPLSVSNSFRLGTSGVPCSVQTAPLDARLEGIFDRGYTLSCRDALGEVGTMIVVRRDIQMDAAPSLLGSSSLQCGAVENVTVENISNVARSTCRDAALGLDYRRYLLRSEGLSYFVEGLAGYDPALRLAFASIIQDEVVEGEIRVATTEISDAAAFARVQAGQLSEADRRNEAYLRNNGGRYASAAEFFSAIVAQSGGRGRSL